ncbi:MAG: MBL fold metallo-hydrolase [Deltaproteobacteria bacterium]|nr:MBL fold metallo-hydrolase [Deltaproteobacteria bacterium]
MIEVHQFEEVRQIRMSREIDGKPVYWVAAYLVDGLLVDTGCHYTAEELAGYLSGERITRAVNTHFHEDHVGGNHILRDRFGIPLYAHHDSIPLIAEKIYLYPYQETVWGQPLPTSVEELPPVVETGTYTFHVIETPGHSVGHVALVEKTRGWCFSGDIFAREEMKFIRPEEDMGRTVKSMKTLMALDMDRLVLFTSVGKIIEDGRGALRKCTRYIEELAERAADLRSRGFDVQGIMTELFGGEHPFADLTNGQYTTENLVRSVLKMKQPGDCGGGEGS